MSEITVEKEVDGQMSSLPAEQITSNDNNAIEAYKPLQQGTPSQEIVANSVTKLLAIPHVYTANEQFEFETPINQNEFEGRIYTKTTDFERFIDFKEVIIKGGGKEFGNELVIEMTFTSKIPIKNGKLKSAFNGATIPLSKLEPLKDKLSFHSFASEDFFMKMFINHVFSWVPMDQHKSPIELSEYDRLDDEDDYKFSERLQKLQNKETHAANEYYKACMIKTSEYIWELFALFRKEFFSPDNQAHLKDVQDYITTLDSGISDYDYKGIPLPHSFFSDGNYLSYVKPSSVRAIGEEQKSEIINLGPLATIIAKSHSKGSPDYVDVVYRNNGSDQRLVCRLDELMDTRKILGLADKGFVVRSNTAGYYTAYFMELLALDDNRISKGKNPLIKRMHAATRNGFYDDGNTFVYGNNTITKVVDPETGKPKRYRFTDEEVAKRYVQKGTLERQLEGLKCILKNDQVVHFKQYASLSAPFKAILKIIQCNVVVHIGDRRSGKGITTQSAGSIWGNPTTRDGGLLKPSGSIAGLQQLWHEQTMTFFGLTELSILEARSSKKGDEFFKDLIYIFSESSSGALSDKGRKNLAQKDWCGDLILNGENSLLTSHDNAGQLFRMIEIKQAMIEDRKAIEEFNKIIFIEENYGHVALLVIAEILIAGKEQIYFEFKSYKEKFIEVLGDSRGMGNMAETFSVYALAGKYLNKVYEKYGIPTLDPFQTVLEISGKYMKDVNPDEHIGIKSLRAFKSWFDGNYKKFNPPIDIVYFAGDGRTATKEIKQSFDGFYKGNYIDVFPENFVKIMERDLGFPSGETIKELWEQLGIAERNVPKNIGTNEEGKKLYTKVFRIFEDKMIDSLFTEAEKMQALEEANVTSGTKAPTSYDAGITAGKDLLMLELFKRFNPNEPVIDGSPIVKQWYNEFMEKI